MGGDTLETDLGETGRAALGALAENSIEVVSVLAGSLGAPLSDSGVARRANDGSVAFATDEGVTLGTGGPDALVGGDLVTSGTLSSSALTLDQIEVSRAFINDVALTVDVGLTLVTLVSLAVITNNLEVDGAAGSSAFTVRESEARTAEHCDALASIVQ